MNGGLLQVRFAFRGFDVPLDRLGVSPSADDGRIKQALARHLAVPLDWLNSYCVQRASNGNVLLRDVTFE